MAIAYFRVLVFLCLKTRQWAELFICNWVWLRENGRAGETHFHKNSFALRLVLTQRQISTRKLAISCSNSPAVCAPHLKNKSKSGNTIKSLEMFGLFIERGEFYDPDHLDELEKYLLSQLQSRMATYRKSVHRRTAGEKCTRDVEESFQAMTPDDWQAIQESELATSLIHHFGYRALQSLLSCSWSCVVALCSFGILLTHPTHLR